VEESLLPMADMRMASSVASFAATLKVPAVVLRSSWWLVLRLEPPATVLSPNVGRRSRGGRTPRVERSLALAASPA
jgi:hypothetical protein